MVWRDNSHSSSELEVTLSKALQPLVHPRGVKHALIQFEWRSDPARMRSMIGKIIVAQRMDKRAEARSFDPGDDMPDRMLEKMDFELGNGVRADWPIRKTAREQDIGILIELRAQLCCQAALFGQIIDMRMVRSFGIAHDPDGALHNGSTCIT